MRLLAFVLFSVLALNVLARRVDHLGLRSLTQHFADDVLGDLSKKIFKDVLTDKDITRLILDGNTQGSDFQTAIIKKTFSIIGNNDEYSKALATKVGDGFSINLNDDDKLKVIKLALNDNEFLDIIQKKGGDTFGRVAELIQKDNDLTQSVSKQAFAKTDTDNKLSDAQKLALFKIYLNNPSLIGAKKLSEEQQTKALKEIENDADLKDFYTANKDYVQTLITKDRK